MADLRSMKSTEIKQVAKSYGIKNWWTKKKDELIAEIEELEAAGDEAMELTKEEDEREKAAVAEYTANWPKYTSRHNVEEFLEKWRKGEIVLESEAKAAEEKDPEVEEIEKQIEAEEKAHMEDVKSIGKTELPDGELKKPKKKKEPKEEVEPFVYTDEDGETWEDYDIGEVIKRWSDEKKAALKSYWEYEVLAHGGTIEDLQDNIEDWSTTYDKAHGVTEKKEGHKPTPKRGALIEWNGKAQNICAWANELGISPNTLYGRLYKLGWSVEKAFTKK